MDDYLVLKHFWELLKIKPILQFNQTERLCLSKMRNIKNALKSIAQFVRDYTQVEYYAHIVYAGNPGLKTF